MRTEENLAALARRIDDFGARIDGFAARMDQMAGHVSELRGMVLEWNDERHAIAYFDKVGRRRRIVDRSRLSEQLYDAMDRGVLTDDERGEVMNADLILSGRRQDVGSDAYFVVEISWGIGLSDTTRAVERARPLSRRGRPERPDDPAAGGLSARLVGVGATGRAGGRRGGASGARPG